MRPVDLLVIHCSATPEGVAYPPEQLERDHLARGFHLCGYHFYIRRSGLLVPMRPLGTIGAHARGFNNRSVGICYEGGIDAHGRVADTRTPQQCDTLDALLIHLTEIWPDARICGHRDLSPDRNADGIITPDEYIKGCPGFDATTEYAGLSACEPDSEPASEPASAPASEPES